MVKTVRKGDKWLTETTKKQTALYNQNNDDVSENITEDDGDRRNRWCLDQKRRTFTDTWSVRRKGLVWQRRKTSSPCATSPDERDLHFRQKDGKRVVNIAETDVSEDDDFDQDVQLITQGWSDWLVTVKQVTSTDTRETPDQTGYDADSDPPDNGPSDDEWAQWLSHLYAVSHDFGYTTSDGKWSYGCCADCDEISGQHFDAILGDYSE